MKQARSVPVAALCGLLVLAACDAPEAGREDGAGPVVVFGTGTVAIETGDTMLTVRAELARTAEERAHGLMERPSLPADAGMLFLYDEPQSGEGGFWMFRTRIPLDIAFLDAEGRIVAIRQMAPCPSPNPDVCPRYAPGRPFSAALEMNRGYFAEHGVEVGDRVTLGSGSEAEGGSR